MIRLRQVALVARDLDTTTSFICDLLGLGAVPAGGRKLQRGGVGGRFNRYHSGGHIGLSRLH